jgi:site-specific DNA recombinase
MECVAYIRVSTEEQVQGTSLSTQEKACRTFARNKGWKLPKTNIFRDEGQSAKATNRPQLLAMLEYCRVNKGKVSHCIVWKLDRFARSAEDHMMLRALFRKHGTRLVSVTEAIDESPTGKLMETVLSGFAQFDNDVRTHRTTEGMKKRLEQGGWPHDAPYGYVKAKSKTGITSIAPDPKNAPKMRMLLEAFSTGEYTVKQAANLAFELGITQKSGKKRTWQTIKNSLENPIYAGYIQSKYTYGNRYIGLHKPIIDLETFEKNINILNNKKRPFIRSDEQDYPLRRDFLKCVHCLNFVTASAPRGGTGVKFPRYSCAHCRSSVIGAKVSKSSDLVHKEFKSILSCIRYKEGRLKLFKQIVLDRWCDDYDDALKTAHEVNKELEKLKIERSKVIRKFTKDELSHDEKESVVAEIDEDIKSLRKKKNEADVYADQKEQIVDKAMLFMKDPSEFWNQAPIQIQKRVQRIIFPEGLSYDFEKGFRTVKVNESYQLIKNIAEEKSENPIVVAATGIEPVTSGL